MAARSAAPAWQRALVVLTGTVVGAVVVGCLYWAQTVLIPVALAVFLAFLLAPLVTILQRWHLRRTPSVVVVVLLAAVVLGGVAWLVAAEAKGLAADLPTYTANIRGKIRSLRQMGPDSITDRLDKMVQEITGEWNTKPAGEAAAGEAGPANPAAVVLQPDSPAWLARLPAALMYVAQSLGGLALALVLVVFMLQKREDLRNRLIRLVGHGRLTVTTKAVDDAGQRISRYLLMQVIINGSYGLVLAAGLLAIRVPHALLWGFLAALLRYVPYLGTMITSLVLVGLSVAAFPGWAQLLLVLGLIATLELVTYNVVEPWLFSRSTGVSEVAVLVSAAFWAFLWGPVGLVLSSPLTVCLVVLGKYVPRLEFLDVLLGDEEALAADVSFYQRLLARDQDEAAQLVLARAKEAPSEGVYDEILVPTLNATKRDRARDDLTEADELFILGATREIMADLGERKSVAAAADASAAAAGTGGDPPGARIRILGCPGRDAADRLALEMLQQVLDPARWEVEILPLEMLSAESVDRAGEEEPAVVCVGALPPGGLAHTRYLCKRLRGRLPGAKIVVGRWGLKTDLEANREQLAEAGADLVETTLVGTRDHLTAWLPVFAQDDLTGVPDRAVKNRYKDAALNRPIE